MFSSTGKTRMIGLPCAEEIMTC